jgi:hypothetical protein
MDKSIAKLALPLAALTLVTAVGAAPQTGASAPKTGQVQSAQVANSAPQAPAKARATVGGLFNGREVPVKRGVILLLDDSAAVSPKHTAKLPIGTRGASIPVETIEVSGGRVDAQIPAGAAQGVLLQAAGVQAISTSGHISMVASGNSVVVAVFNGEALVGEKGRFKTLASGEIRKFDLKTGQTTQHAFLSAPTTGSSGLGVALSGEAEVRISSSPVAGAVRYRTVLLNGDGTQAGDATESSDPQALKVTAPRAGSYLSIVRAVDEFGFAGAPSEPKSVQVLGLSNGTDVVRHGLILLGPGEAAHIVGQEGLEMRYGTSPEFIPAPTSISLPGRKATTVEFRDPRDPNRFAVFKLAPRVLNARIVVGTPESQWPRDNIDISVKMWDGLGDPLSWMDDYRMVVKVGLEEVPLEWQRGNGELTTILPPQQGPGPWVVRVSVVDPTGTEIGRNFLEVVAPPAAKQ